MGSSLRNYSVVRYQFAKHKKTAVTTRPRRLFANPPTIGGKNGAAARLTRIERASAHALTDPGQRQKLVPLPNELAGVSGAGIQPNTFVS